MVYWQMPDENQVRIPELQLLIVVCVNACVLHICICRYREFGEKLMQLKGGFLLMSMPSQDPYPTKEEKIPLFAGERRNYESTSHS